MLPLPLYYRGAARREGRYSIVTDVLYNNNSGIIIVAIDLPR